MFQRVLRLALHGKLKLTVSFLIESDCLTTGDSLADNMYSWWHGTQVRVNVLNRMLQREALAFAQTSGFTTIIVVQWADLMICKTRWLSIRQQGMRNPLMNFGLLFETILGACVCFVPFLNAALQTRPLRFTHWMPGMPFMVVIFSTMRLASTSCALALSMLPTHKLGK